MRRWRWRRRRRSSRSDDIHDVWHPDLIRHPEVAAERRPSKDIGLKSTAVAQCMAAYVYMLRCADGSFYVGSATGTDLSRRISEHQSGSYPGYTWSRRPVELVWSEHFDRITDAIAAERKLKGWSRAKKAALVNSDFTLLHQLARRRAGKPKLA